MERIITLSDILDSKERNQGNFEISTELEFKLLNYSYSDFEPFFRTEDIEFLHSHLYRIKIEDYNILIREMLASIKGLNVALVADLGQKISNLMKDILLFESFFESIKPFEGNIQINDPQIERFFDKNFEGFTNFWDIITQHSDFPTYSDWLVLVQDKVTKKLSFQNSKEKLNLENEEIILSFYFGFQLMKNFQNNHDYFNVVLSRFIDWYSLINKL